MDSALGLHSGALHIPSTTYRLAAISRPYSSFRPPSSASTYRSLSRHACISPVTCSLNKPSTPSPNYNNDNGKKILKVLGGASVVLACVIGVVNCKYVFSTTAIARSKEKPAMEEKEPRQIVVKGTREILDSLFLVKKPGGSPKSKPSSFKLLPSFSKQQQTLSEEPSMYDCDEFLQAAKIIDLKACRNAETQLRRLRDNIMAKREGGKVYPETAYHVEMALVVLLIYQAKYEDASKCMCLHPDNAISTDGRVPLYKAIIYTMLEPKHQDEEDLQNYREEAMKYWKIFVNFSSTAIPSWEELQENTPKSEVETKKERRVPH